MLVPKPGLAKEGTFPTPTFFNVAPQLEGVPLIAPLTKQSGHFRNGNIKSFPRGKLFQNKVVTLTNNCSFSSNNTSVSVDREEGFSPVQNSDVSDWVTFEIREQ